MRSLPLTHSAVTVKWNQASYEFLGAMSSYIKGDNKLQHPSYDTTLKIFQLCNVSFKGLTRELVLSNIFQIAKSHKILFSWCYSSQLEKKYIQEILDICGLVDTKI